jgi:uncharacterized protein (DUF849 family)
MVKTIITAALTGVGPTKKDNPNVPITPNEIAKDVFECWKAGAAVVHLHMRDDEGRPTMDFAKFRETVKLIRDCKECDVILNLTTSGSDVTLKDEDRWGHLEELRPEIGSFDCGSMNWGHTSVFINSPTFLEALGKYMQEWNVKPEIEVFDTGMMYNALHYLKTGALKNPLHFQFVLGAPGGMAATVDNLIYLKNLLPPGATWGAFGIGRMHLPIMFTTLALGGHIRVGMEDNIMFEYKVLAKSNAQFVKRAAEIIRILGNEVATPADAREILGLVK